MAEAKGEGPLPALRVPGIGAFGDVHQLRLIDAVCWSADQDEAPVSIAPIDITMLVDLEIDFRVTECGGFVIHAGTDVGCAIAPHPPRGYLGP